MIDRTMLDPNKLLDLILADCGGNHHSWWVLVEFVKDYMPPFPQADTRPTKCSIKCGKSFLRDLGHGVFIWDIHYGEDSEFHTPEHALLVLMQAPVPPYLLIGDVWEAISKWRNK